MRINVLNGWRREGRTTAFVTYSSGFHSVFTPAA